MWIGRRDRRDAVLGQHDHARAVALGIGDQIARDRIDLGEALGDPRIVRTEALQVVVEVRQVDQRQRGRARAPDMQRGVRDPARAAIDVAGPQKWNSGKAPSACVSSSRSSGGCV